MIAAAALHLAACTADDSSRPPSVPAEAFWLGGQDGGVFVLLERVDQTDSDLYFGTVYVESTGAIWYEGQLSVEPTGGADFDYRNSDAFSGWDGDTLYLRDNRVLKTVSP